VSELVIGIRKTTKPMFRNFGGKVGRELRNKPLDFGANRDHVTLQFGLKLRYG